MRASLIFIGVVFLFIGGLFVAIGGSTFLEERRYQRRGVRVEAIASGKTLHRATDATSTAYEIRYRFSLPDGTSHAQSEHVPVHVWERTDVDSTLTVEYLHGEPSSARVVRDNRDRKFVRWLLLGGGLVIGALAFFTRGFRRATDETPSPPPRPDIAVAQEPSFWPLARRSHGFWFGGIFLSVGLPMFLGAGWQIYDHVMLLREASVTHGIVLTKDIKRSGKQNRTKRYEATYRYTVAGKTFEGRDELSFDGWTRLIEREPVDVLYRAQKPDAGRLAGPRPWLGGSAFLTVLGAIFTGIGATFFLGSIRRARLEWRLRQSGVNTPGTVVELRELPLKIDDVQQWRLHYRYQDLRGQVHDQTINIPEDEAAQWNIGDVGKVLYDSAQPAEAVWLGRDHRDALP